MLSASSTTSPESQVARISAMRISYCSAWVPTPWSSSLASIFHACCDRCWLAFEQALAARRLRLPTRHSPARGQTQTLAAASRCELAFARCARQPCLRTARWPVTPMTPFEGHGPAARYIRAVRGRWCGWWHH